MAADLAGPRDRVDEPLGELLGLLRAGLDRDHGELVAPVAADDVLAPQHARQPMGDTLEHRVADLVAEVVVDRLEAIQVQQDQGECPAVAARASELALDGAPEQPVVAQAGERILVGQPAGRGLPRGPDVPLAAQPLGPGVDHAAGQDQGKGRDHRVGRVARGHAVIRCKFISAAGRFRPCAEIESHRFPGIAALRVQPEARRRFVAAMRHAVLAARVPRLAADHAVLVPIHLRE